MYVFWMSHSKTTKRVLCFYIFGIMIADDLVTGVPWALTDVIFGEKLYEYTCTLIYLLKH